MNWKDAPTRGQMWINKSLELQILLSCNWRCIACDQGSNFGSFDFVKQGAMAIEQIEFFAHEMISNNAYIGRIRVMGGEPTVHPEFETIIKLLNSTLVPNHIGRIEVITNGTHNDRLKPIKDLIGKARVSGQSQKEGAHIANLIHTPESLGYPGRICSSPWHCGISLNAWGYFPCSAGAGISRFEDWMKWQRLTLPLSIKPCNAVMDNWPDLQSLCGHCYHGLKEEDKIKCGTSDKTRNEPGEHIRSKLDEWKAGKKATWERYGE